jgi:hypothetical protein
MPSTIRRFDDPFNRHSAIGNRQWREQIADCQLSGVIRPTAMQSTIRRFDNPFNLHSAIGNRQWRDT